MRKKRRMVWLLGEFATGSTVPFQSLLQLTDQVQVRDDLDGDATLLRIVGDYTFSVDVRDCTPNFGVTLDIGIIKIQADVAGNPPISALLTPANAAGQTFPWLFVRQYTYVGGSNISGTARDVVVLPSQALAQFVSLPVAPGGAAQSSTTSFLNSPRLPTVDIKVRRRIRQGEVLVFYWTVSAAWGCSLSGTECFLANNLRTLYATGRR